MYLQECEMSMTNTQQQHHHLYSSSIISISALVVLIDLITQSLSSYLGGRATSRVPNCKHMFRSRFGLMFVMPLHAR